MGVVLAIVPGVVVAGDSSLHAWVEVEAGDRRLIVKPMARANHWVTVSYDMVVISENAAGRSHTRQRGEVEVGRKDTILSTVQVGTARGQRYTIELEAADRNGGQVEVRRVHGANE